MNENKKEPKVVYGVTARLLIISVLPAMLLGIVILVIGILSQKSGMEEEALKGLLANAYTYRDRGLLDMDREDGDNDIEKQLKENTGYDFTWFDGEKRKNSSLGSAVIGTRADETVIKEVINNKNEFTSKKTKVAGEDYFVAYVPVTDSDGKVIGMAFTGVSRESVESQIGKSITTMLLSGISLLLIVIGIVLPVAITMSRAVKAIDEIIKKLSDGEFIKAEKYLTRSDEIGSALRSANKLVDKISEVVKDIHENSELVGLQSSELAKTSKDISEVAEGVTHSVTQIAEGATEQADTIQNATLNIESLSAAIKNVAGYSEQLAGTANEMNEAGQSSSTAIKTLSKEMTVMEESVKSVTRTMAATNQAVQTVDQKTANITRIASQTNLLALNASIEAARAGEAGRGFSVVAEEIGKLAVEASTTAKEIRDEMVNLITQSNDAAIKTEDIEMICKNVTQVLIDTEGKISHLIKNVETTVDGVTTISALTEECEASKLVIVDAMSSLSAISEENAATTEETSAAMQEVNEDVSLLAKYSSDLKAVAENLNKDLRFFKI